MALQNNDLAGMWDVYSRGMHSELNLMPNGQYTHMLWGGVQGYWGIWSLREDPQGPVLHLALAGAQPQVSNGPMGPQPMHWPEFEDWLVTGMQGNILTTTDSMLSRRVAPGAGLPGFGFPAPQPILPAMPYGGFAAPAATQVQPPHQATAVTVQAVATAQAPAAPHPQAPAMPAPQPYPPPQFQAPQQAPAVPQFQMPVAPQFQMPAAPGQPPAPTVASIYAQMNAQDLATTASINARWQQLHTYQIGVVRQENDGIVAATHAAAQRFIHYAGS